MKTAVGTVVTTGKAVDGSVLCDLVSGGGESKFTTQTSAPDADYLARTMLQAYDWQGALESCREVLDKDPDHLGALEVTAQALWYAGRYEEVVRTTNRLLKLNPLEPGYRYTRGMAHMSVGRLNDAARDFQQAIVQSNDPRFLAQVRSALFAIEEFQKGGLDMAARMNATRSARQHFGFSPQREYRVH